jgi:hypothetical protein
LARSPPAIIDRATHKLKRIPPGKKRSPNSHIPVLGDAFDEKVRRILDDIFERRVEPFMEAMAVLAEVMRSALASYVGVIPRLRESGKRKKTRTAPPVPLGNARLRRALWMPTLSAVRVNPWLRASYQRLRAVGKPAKVALVAAMRKLMAAAYSVARHRRPFTLTPVSRSPLALNQS